MTIGRTICLYGDSNGGKTTQAAQLAKCVKRTQGKRTRLYKSDPGGHAAFGPLVERGMVDLIEFEPTDDPWVWTNDAVEGRGRDGSPLPDDIGLIVFDSGTSMGDECMKGAAKQGDLGGRPAPRFTIKSTVKGRPNLDIKSNSDSHYMVVQTFMHDMINKSTWLTRKGVDVLWTFAAHRVTNQGKKETGDMGVKYGDTEVGPKLVGNALTRHAPRWFNYTFPLTVEAGSGSAAIHRLHLEPYRDNHEVIWFANSRWPLEATSPCPPMLEPADLPKALELLAQAEAEARAALEQEMRG